MGRQWTERRLGNFWAKVDKTRGCWLWTGAHSSGVPQFRLGDPRFQAQRLMYELMIGEIPGGHVVYRTCENLSCVKPSHLDTVPNGWLSSYEAHDFKCIAGHDVRKVGLHKRGKGHRCAECNRQAVREHRRRQ